MPDAGPANDKVEIDLQVSGYPGDSAGAFFVVTAKDADAVIDDVSISFGSGEPFDSAGGACFQVGGPSARGNAGVDLKAFENEDSAVCILSGRIDGESFFAKRPVPMPTAELRAAQEELDEDEHDDESGGDESEEE